MSRELIATLTSKGQVTLPIEIRRRLGLDAGDKIAFSLNPDGTILVKPPTYPNVESLRGVAGTLQPPMSWDEVERVVEEDWAAESVERQR